MAHRTALITAVSIVAVVFASAAAVGANLGILTVADAGPVGDLSATAVAPRANGPEVVDVYVDDTKGTISQQYKVEKAGTIGVVATKKGVRLDDITVKPGWRWTLVQNAQKLDRDLQVEVHHIQVRGLPRRGWQAHGSGRRAGHENR